MAAIARRNTVHRHVVVLHVLMRGRTGVKIICHYVNGGEKWLHVRMHVRTCVNLRTWPGSTQNGQRDCFCRLDRAVMLKMYMGLLSGNHSCAPLQLPGSGSSPGCHLLAISSWTICLTSLGVSLSTYKMEITPTFNRLLSILN